MRAPESPLLAKISVVSQRIEQARIRSPLDGVVLATMTSEGGIEPLEPAAVAEVASRTDAPPDICVIAPVGTDPGRYEEAGATWVLFTGWLDELRDLAAAAPRT